MLSPSMKQSSSLKSLTDSQVNTDMSDLQENQQKHQQTVRRFSILSGIQDELNRKLDQKPLGINSIIVEQDEQQSIRKSKQSQDLNRMLGAGTVSDYTNTQKYLKTEYAAQGNSSKNQHLPSYRYKSNENQNLNQNSHNLNQYHSHNPNQKKHYEQIHITKQVPLIKLPQPRMYKVNKTINLLHPAPPIIHHPRAFYKQTVEDSFEQGELFGAALSTQRKQLYQLNNKL